jgi:hypothetical protein
MRETDAEEAAKAIPAAVRVLATVRVIAAGRKAVIVAVRTPTAVRLAADCTAGRINDPIMSEGLDSRVTKAG